MLKNKYMSFEIKSNFMLGKSNLDHRGGLDARKDIIYWWVITYDLGAWSEKKLRDYLLNPQSVVPGTTMPNPDLSSNEVNDIVKILIK